MPKPAIHLDAKSGSLLAVGTAMLVAGFFYPGSQATVATTFILVGAGLFATGILLPGLSEFEIGLGGLKTKLAESPPQLELDFETDELPRFAHLVLGDSRQARELVEEALARSRQTRRRLGAAERDVFVLRTLIQLLDSAPWRSWLRGTSLAIRSPRVDHASPNDDDVIVALQRLSFAERVAFLLHADFSFRPEEIAALVDRPVELVTRDLERARDLLTPALSREA